MYQTQQKINLRVERDFGDKLNATFLFLRLNFKPLARVLFYYVTPFALAAGVTAGLLQARLLSNLSPATMGEYNMFSQMTSFGYIFSMGLSFLSICMLYLAVHCYMVVYHDQEGEVQPELVWELMKENLVKVILSSIAIGAIVGLSFFIFGLGIYFAFVFSIIIMVMVREDAGLGEAMSRCFYLVKSNWWATFGFLLIVFIIQGVISWLAAMPVTAITFLKLFKWPGADSDFLVVVASTLSSVLNIFVYTISAVAISIQYYSLVEKKDGIGLMEQADQIGRQNLDTSANEGHY